MNDPFESLSVNEVTIVGGVGAKPKFHKFKNGNLRASFPVVTKKKYVSSTTGEDKEYKCWHTIVVRNKEKVPEIMRYIIPGSQVYVRGEIDHETWKYEEGDSKQRRAIVLAHRVELIRPNPKKKDEEGYSPIDNDEEEHFSLFEDNL